ncbi:hypothetical protein AWW72_05700 [Acinetobacter sp. NRRL B-65365]|nr:hypothetical protein AWW72_05700 [Acinetobacter sp. NRRL B-65365]
MTFIFLLSNLNISDAVDARPDYSFRQTMFFHTAMRFMHSSIETDSIILLKIQQRIMYNT